MGAVGLMIVAMRIMLHVDVSRHDVIATLDLHDFDRRAIEA
jgi:hypothetical protein